MLYINGLLSAIGAQNAQLYPNECSNAHVGNERLQQHFCTTSIKEELQHRVTVANYLVKLPV